MEQNRPLTPFLGESFHLLFRNYTLFIPYIISMAIGLSLLLLPVSQTLAELSANPDAELALGDIPSVLFFVVFSVLLSLIIYGWVFAAIQPIVMGRRLEIFSEFLAGLRMALTIFLQLLLALLAGIIAALLAFLIVMAVTASYALSLGIGVALTIVCVLAGILLIVFLTGFGMQVGASLIVERAGPLASLGAAWRFMRRNKGKALIMALITIGLLIASYIPSMAYSLALGEKQAEMMRENMMGYSLIFSVLSIPSIIAMTSLLIFYSLVYKESTGKESKGHLKPTQPLGRKPVPKKKRKS